MISGHQVNERGLDLDCVIGTFVKLDVFGEECIAIN
jgi:hypothetical protein